MDDNPYQSPDSRDEKAKFSQPAPPQQASNKRAFWKTFAIVLLAAYAPSLLWVTLSGFERWFFVISPIAFIWGQDLNVVVAAFGLLWLILAAVSWSVRHSRPGQVVVSIILFVASLLQGMAFALFVRALHALGGLR